MPLQGYLNYSDDNEIYSVAKEVGLDAYSGVWLSKSKDETKRSVTSLQHQILP